MLLEGDRQRRAVDGQALMLSGELVWAEHSCCAARPNSHATRRVDRRCFSRYTEAMRRLNDNTHRLIERTGLTLTEFAQRADIDRTILYRIGRPLRGSTAWKIANAYAAAAGITPDDAYQLLIAEAPADDSEPR